MNGFIFDDMRLGTSPVIDGRELDLWWDPHDKGARPRNHELRSTVLHFTGGERDAEGICQTLKNRGLSVHFTIDNAGIIIQHADIGRTVTQHAGFVNNHSIGIEIASRGIAPALRGHPRVTYDARIHGRRLTLLEFNPLQVISATKLVTDIHRTLGMRLDFPRHSDGSVYSKKLPRNVALKYEGVMGHWHVSSAKVDPGPQIFRELDKRISLCKCGCPCCGQPS